MSNRNDMPEVIHAEISGSGAIWGAGDKYISNARISNRGDVYIKKSRYDALHKKVKELEDKLALQK